MEKEEFRVKPKGVKRPNDVYNFREEEWNVFDFLKMTKSKFWHIQWKFSSFEQIQSRL